MPHDSISDSSSEDEYQMENARRRCAGPTGKSSAIVVRPRASAGFWLCCLFPLVYVTHYLRGHVLSVDCATPSSTNAMLSVAALGMCIESLCFFMYMFLDTGLHLKLLMSFVPGLLSTILFKVILQQTWLFGIFWGFIVTFCYQNVYIHAMRGLPRCFTFGEAAVVIQGLTLFVLNAILQLPRMLFDEAVHGEFAELNTIMIFSLFCLVVVCFLLAVCSWFRRPLQFYILMSALVLTVTCVPVTDPFPLVTILKFIFSDRMRLNIISFYLVLVGLTTCTVWLQLRNTQKASTSVRKIFHILIVLVYLPGILYQCNFLYISSGVALAIFTVLELFRILHIPPISTALNSAFVSFCDEKDAGGLALTPFSLLIGCSLPVWISLCPCRLTIVGASMTRLPELSGILILGFGDTAASVIGSRFGRIKWRGSNRSLEGTIAFIVAIILAVAWLNFVGFIALTHAGWLIVFAAAFISALVEAHTDQIDNLVLPFIFYTIVSFA